MKYIVLYVGLLCAVACQNIAAPEQKQNPVSVTQEQLIEYNKDLVAEENNEIEALLLRYKWHTSTTETGIHYLIYEKGTGVEIKTGDILQCPYTLKLIAGEEIYDSATDGALIFKIGKSDQPSGLEEVLLLLRQGDKAKVIVPSYRAYGIAGDGNKIPSSATLIYDIYIEQVIQQQSIK